MTEFIDIASDYIAEKRAIGYKMEKANAAMVRIAELHSALGCAQDELPKELCEAWCERRLGEMETTRMLRVSQIRGLAQYMARLGYRAYVVPDRYGFIRRNAYRPHIFSDSELASLFAAADSLVCNKDSACTTAQKTLILRLLYSTGMRSGEACALRKPDVDLDAGTVVIRHAKNDKDCVIPLHPSMTERLRIFVNEASLRHPCYCQHDRFWSWPDNASVNTDLIYRFFRRVLWRAGISHGGRGKGPRVHDLRFTFACHRLRAWVREGADVNALMPILAVYMGHADTRCTEYYLRLTAELYPEMVAAVERECGWMVPL